jgi:hypothetical protein
MSWLPQARGNTFVAGAGVSSQFPPAKCTTDAKTESALYHFKAGTAGTWTAGPVIKPIGGKEFATTDGPGATLPDGNVLFDASACVFNTPTHFFLYHASSNTITQIPDVPNAPKDTSFATRMLDLPNGQVLFNDGHRKMLVYTAGGKPKASWRPSITSLNSTTLLPGSTYSLSGKQLAGLDQGTAYGDDVQNATNFPRGADHQRRYRRGDLCPDQRLDVGVGRSRHQLLHQLHAPRGHAGGQEHAGGDSQRDRLSAFGGEGLLGPQSGRSRPGPGIWGGPG